MSTPDETDPILRYADAAAALLGLPLPEERRAAVIEHLRLAQRLAGVVADHPVSTADEPAPVFRP